MGSGAIGPSGGEVVGEGTRTDVQDYDLKKWVEQDKLFWLDPDNEEGRIIRGPAEAFPYRDTAGKRYSRKWRITSANISTT